MAKLKLTKQSLRQEQATLKQLKEYLPTLMLKKMMLQFEVNQVKQAFSEVKEEHKKFFLQLEQFSSLLSSSEVNLMDFIQVQHVQKHYENVAGVEIPIFEDVLFMDRPFSLFDTPPWMDTAIEQMKQIVILKEKMGVLQEKKRVLEKDLRDVTIRVNLFEKVLIPRTNENIKKIQIFLQDLELAAVCQAKVAKMKIEKQKL
jgi:V/A-type H+-transporting ATPase subunit D